MDISPTCEPALREPSLPNTWREQERKRSRVVGSGARRATDPVAGMVRGISLKSEFGGEIGEKAVACIEDLARDGLASDRRLVLASSVREAVEKADIVITVTASREPLVRADWIAREHW